MQGELYPVLLRLGQDGLDEIGIVIPQLRLGDVRSPRDIVGKPEARDLCAAALRERVRGARPADVRHEVEAYGAHIQLVHDGEHLYDLVDALIAHRVPGLYMVVQAVRHRLNNYGAYAVVHEAGVNAYPVRPAGGVELCVLRQAYRAVLHAALAAELPGRVRG